MNKPVVSIICLAYNHENYIREALEGFVMQKTNFPFEIVIHDDASTDNTASIIREYQAKYPDLFNPIFQSENQYSKERGRVTKIVFDAAQGKYVSLCEGDDYWTDPLKLQKQVDFLENNPGYTVTVGGFISKHKYDNTEKIIIRKNKVRNNDDTKNGYTFTLEDTYKNWSTKVLTATFINDKELLSSLLEYQYSRDVHLFYHLLKKGKGFYFTEVFGVYRMHTGGVHSMVDSKKLVVGAYKIYKELYDKNKDDYTRKMSLNYHLILMNLKIFNNKFMKNYDIKFSLLFKNAIKLIKQPKDLMLFYQVFVGGNLKNKIKRWLKKS